MADVLPVATPTGLFQLEPPLEELVTKTSVSVVTVEEVQGAAHAATPLRLSEKEM